MREGEETRIELVRSKPEFVAWLELLRSEPEFVAWLEPQENKDDDDEPPRAA